MKSYSNENLFLESKSEPVMRKEPTRYSPFVEISESGYIKISGNSVAIESVEFYQSLFSAIESIYSSKVCISLMLENINANSIRGLFLLLDKVREQKFINDIDVFWFFTEENEDFEKVGEIFQEMFPTINFSIFRI